MEGGASDPDLADKNAELLESNSSLKVAVTVIAIAAGLIAAGFVLYIFVFSKKNF